MAAAGLHVAEYLTKAVWQSETNFFSIIILSYSPTVGNIKNTKKLIGGLGVPRPRIPSLALMHPNKTQRTVAHLPVGLLP